MIIDGRAIASDLLASIREQMLARGVSPIAVAHLGRRGRTQVAVAVGVQGRHNPTDCKRRS